MQIKVTQPNNVSENFEIPFVATPEALEHLPFGVHLWKPPMRVLHLLLQHQKHHLGPEDVQKGKKTDRMLGMLVDLKEMDSRQESETRQAYIAQLKYSFAHSLISITRYSFEHSKHPVNTFPICCNSSVCISSPVHR
jgi:hypothetical protein